MKIAPHPKARLWGRQIEGLVILAGLAVLLGAGLPIVARLKERGAGSGGALAGGLLGGLLILGVVVLVLSAIAYVLDWRMCYRCGDKVRVSMGVHQGAVGIVKEPLTGGHRARVALQLDGRTEIVDFQGWQIRKIK
jgi:membrane protein implicated in regulation of membrane protease activity